MTVRPFSRWDRDYITATGVTMTTPGGDALTPVVAIALVPVNGRPGVGTTWHDTVSRPDGPSLLLAGESAAQDGDVVLTAPVDAYGRFTAGGVVVIEELGRVPYRP